MAILAGLLCAPRMIKGLGLLEAIKGKSGNDLTASDFDVFNRNETPQEELTVEKVMSVLGGKA